MKMTYLQRADQYLRMAPEYKKTVPLTLFYSMYEKLQNCTGYLARTPSIVQNVVSLIKKSKNVFVNIRSKMLDIPIRPPLFYYKHVYLRKE